MVAGDASLELYSNVYFINGADKANIYLEKAKKYYKLLDYKNGLLEAKQMQAYVKFVEGDFLLCNELIYKHLEACKKTKDDAYLYLFALYMLTTNYLYLDDFDSAYYHFKEFKALKGNSTIVPINYKSFEASLDVSFAEVYYKRKQIDSTMYYLSEASKNRQTMGEHTIKNYFTVNYDVYKHLGRVEASSIYLDSLRKFEEKMFDNIVDASFQINEALLRTEAQLKHEAERKYFNGVLGVVLFFVFASVSLVYFIYYKRQKLKLKNLGCQAKHLSYLKSSNAKLTAKVNSLEEYINILKADVKSISSIGNVNIQRDKIKEFYKTLHLNSCTLIDKSENHLKLVNDFNIDFFEGLSDLYPQLSNSEIIICYYLFIGFKNKEIAVFLNTSIRAVESKRYRITKKINLNRKETSLVDFLKDTFKETPV